MLLLGVLSVLQLILVPGLLLIRLFPGQRSFIQQSAFVFVLSLLVNYILVIVLTALGLYYRSVILLVFALEVLALGWLHRRQLWAAQELSFKTVRRYFSGQARALKAWVAKDPLTAVLYSVCAAFAILALLWILQVWVANFLTVFEKWDSWASWDRWAEVWANNRIPGDTWEYPQLIPILLSIPYKFIGTVAVKFFGKSIMPLFAALAVLVFIDLGRRYRSFGYLLAASLAIYSFNFFLPEYFWEVYVDIPVASMGAFAIATLLCARIVKNKVELQTLLTLGFLVTAVVGVTKQTGMYIVAVYPLFAYLWVLRDRRDFDRRKALLFIGRNLLLVLIMVLPWYLYVQYNIMLGNRTSNIQYVISDIYGGQTLWERFVIAVRSLHLYIYWYIFLLLSLPVLSRPLRQLVLLVVLPFSILWAVFLSYEYRNLAIALPLLALVNGAAVEEWVLRGRRWLASRGSAVTWRSQSSSAASGFLRPAKLLALLLALGALFSLTVTGDDLIARQVYQERAMFSRPLNDRLYSYLSQTGGPEPIITFYPVGWLPDLEGTWRFEKFEDLAGFQQTLANNPRASLLLVPFWAAPPIWDFIHQQIAADLYEIQFIQEQYTLIRILD
ncbi:MAG: hypothetical protein KJZ53_07795 [Anaerolineales bacterium]|nr:hypothetical protein [Anaerolineales bacterium]